MSRLRQLAGQTVIYGLTSILGKFINYLLTPLLTGVFEPEAYGVQSVLYSYIAIALALLTFGMETAMFRYSGMEHADKRKVFATAQNFVTLVSAIFLVSVFIFAQPIAGVLGYPKHTDYVILFSLIIFLDALSSVPLAKLREENRPGMFTLISILNILINFGLVLFFLVYCRGLYMKGGEESLGILAKIYDHDKGVAYIFIANIVASAVKFAMLLPVVFRYGMRSDPALLRQMLVYAIPLAIGALAYIINEKADLIFLKQLLPASEGDEQAGIYGACYKLAILLTIFIQAFRYAAEPFFFGMHKDTDTRHTLALVMDYFVWFCLFIFLVVALYVDVFKWIFLRDEAYWSGIDIVPVLLIANLYNGIYQNLSMWYKLSGKTLYGMYFSITGAAFTIMLNLAFIPIWGFRGSAWATLICYAGMSGISYIVGQKFYPVPYRFGRMHQYILGCIVFYGLTRFIPADRPFIYYFTATAGIIAYVLWVVRNEKSLQALIGKIVNK